MYCQLCDEIVKEKDSLKDEGGWHWAYDVQICPKCSPKRMYSKEELERKLNIEIEDDQVVKRTL